MSAPETEYKDVLWLGEGPKPEKRRRRWRHSGSPFLWLLSFGEAKESSLLWVNHPQVKFIHRLARRQAQRTLRACARTTRYRLSSFASLQSFSSP